MVGFHENTRSNQVEGAASPCPDRFITSSSFSRFELLEKWPSTILQ